MKPKIVRYLMFSIAAGLLLAAMTACGGGGEEPTPEPTPNLRATIEAQVAALPENTATPEPTATLEPTNTPVPPPAPTATPVPTPTPMPTPDVPATIEAAIALTRAAMPPTPTPLPPTATPMPTNTPAPMPTPSPTAPVQSSGPPCIVIGKVTTGGSNAPVGTVVQARIKDAEDSFSVQDQTDDAGNYILTISRFDAVFDLFVDGADTGVDTPRTSRGCRELLNLTVN